MIAVELTIPLRQLIDARLDNIERALMTQSMSRVDRQQVLAAIEEQIFEMLERTSEEEPTRDDVLSVLARLDPPEAYLEPSDCSSTERLQRRQVEPKLASPSPASTGVSGEWNKLAIVSLVATGIACLGAMTWWMLGFLGLVPLTVVTGVAQTCGVISVCQIMQKRSIERGFWMAVIGCCALPMVMLLALFTVFWLELI